MNKIGVVGYNPEFRAFGFFRWTTVYFAGKDHRCRVDVGHSFFCPYHRCNFYGTCKDCPSSLKDIFTL